MSNQPGIGLLGGTFDPPHWGHLWLGELARVQLKLNKVLFLPVGEPVHKTDQQITAVPHRLQMVSLAIQNNPNFLLDTTDCDRAGPHTTVSLLPLLQQAYPDAKFRLLIGGDSLRDLPTWSQPERLIEMCRLVVLPRPGAEIDWELLETAVPGSKTAVDMLSGPTLSISATAIRNWIQQGHEPNYLLPTAVSEYIQRHHLYRQETTML